MRICFLVYGFGEFAQAESFGAYCKRRGIDTFFLINQSLSPIANGLNYKIYGNRESIYKMISEYNPDILFLCNSKTAGQFMWEEMPKAKLTMSLDSNWMITPHSESLYGWEGIRFPDWLDYYVMVFPEKIYKAGLKYFKIADDFKKRIITPGFIPGVRMRRYSRQEISEFRKKHNIHGKYVFVYLGRGVTYNFKPLRAICSCLKEYKDLTIMHIGERRIDTRANLIVKKWVNNFELAMVSSDLVIQHDAFGTLTRVISNRIPVLCLWNGTRTKEAELTPFYDLGLIEMERWNNRKGRTMDLEKLKRKLDLLLFDESYRTRMRQAQKSFYEAGERNLLSIIKRLLNSRVLSKDNTVHTRKYNKSQYT